MTFYNDLPALLVRFGRTADKPITPPGKSAAFWDLETGLFWAVNDAMQWVSINPAPVYSGEAHIRIKPVATSVNPSVLAWLVPSLGAFIFQAVFVVEEAYDSGVTFSVGDVGDNERLIAAADIDPETPDSYPTIPVYQYAPGDAINVYQNMASATGAATLYLFYDENVNT